jgi:hypothetical protein
MTDNTAAENAAALLAAVEDVLSQAAAKMGTAPTWQPGDVVLIRNFGKVSDTRTYVRCGQVWPTGFGRPLTDAQITRAFHKGDVTPLLQGQGQPFDPARLP